MVLGNTEKVSILVTALEASYRALSAAAARAQLVCLWSLGLALTGAAWLAHGDAILAADQAVILAAGVLAAWFALRLAFLADLRKSFAVRSARWPPASKTFWASTPPAVSARRPRRCSPSPGARAARRLARPSPPPPC